MRAREALLDAHLGLVHHVARRLQRSLSDEVQYDELLGAGTIGLMEALQTFDPERGMAFSTFAVPRIRGAILDDLRRRDRVSRSVRQKLNAMRDAEEGLRQALGREPAPAETAEALGIDLETLHGWRRLAESTQEVSLDQRTGLDHERGETGSLEAVVPTEDVSIDVSLERDDEIAAVRAALERLGERERLVLSLYYYEELKLHEIATILEVTESRVSQIRSSALRKLRERLAGDA